MERFMAVGALIGLISGYFFVLVFPYANSFFAGLKPSDLYDVRSGSALNSGHLVAFYVMLLGGLIGFIIYKLRPKGAQK